MNICFETEIGTTDCRVANKDLCWWIYQMLQLYIEEAKKTVNNNNSYYYY